MFSSIHRVRATVRSVCRVVARGWLCDVRHVTSYIPARQHRRKLPLRSSQISRHIVLRFGRADVANQTFGAENLEQSARFRAAALPKSLHVSAAQHIVLAEVGGEARLVVSRLLVPLTRFRVWRTVETHLGESRHQLFGGAEVHGFHAHFLTDLVVGSGEFCVGGQLQRKRAEPLEHDTFPRGERVRHRFRRDGVRGFHVSRRERRGVRGVTAEFLQVEHAVIDGNDEVVVFVFSKTRARTNLILHSAFCFYVVNNFYLSCCFFRTDSSFSF